MAEDIFNTVWRYNV